MKVIENKPDNIIVRNEYLKNQKLIEFVWDIDITQT